MIVVDTENYVIAGSPEISRINNFCLEDIIWVHWPGLTAGVPTARDFYITDDDREYYTIYENYDIPDDDTLWKFFVYPDGSWEFINEGPIKYIWYITETECDGVKYIFQQRTKLEE